jgi:pSer/pThr/pTyr-binding forkhead associated (FHA) protein
MPKLICISGDNKGEEYVLPIGDATIGRSDVNDISVLDKKASRAHCKVVINDDYSAQLVDLNSTNGVRVNNKYVDGAVPLEDGDHIRIGQTVYLMTITEAEKMKDLHIGKMKRSTYEMTRTSNLRRMKVQTEGRSTGFIAFFDNDE